MYTKLKKVNEGFTIVETLIVLAIAALIITIILIAVPDLQRSGRNSNILHDAQNVSSGIQTFEGNNQGLIPSTVAGSAGSSLVTVSGGTNTSDATAHVQASTTVWQDSTYVAGTGGTTTSVVYSGTTAGKNGTIAPGYVYVALGESCGSFASGTPGSYSLNASVPRSVAILYPIEGSSANTSSIGCISE
jgi:prepilin-type N-terminal cleavage/methylation domain-containing protein